METTDPSKEISTLQNEMRILNRNYNEKNLVDNENHCLLDYKFGGTMAQEIFSEVFQSSLIDFKREPKEDSSNIIEETDADIMEAEQMAIHLNEETPNILLDNLL